MAVSGLSVAMLAVGGITLYSGIHGSTLSATVKAALSGDPSTAAVTQTLSFPTGNDAGGSSGSNPGSIPMTSSSVANDALRYVGDKYVWGGTPGTNVGVDNGTDCSGFVNMVVGRDLGGAIPGYKAGAYKGASHGPATGEWLLWGGATTISASQVQAGDLACWLTHIAIATDNGKNVVSALDTKDGVKQTTVAGATPTGEKLTWRRLNAALSAPKPSASGSWS